MSGEFNADGLRPLSHVTEPDPRAEVFVRQDVRTGAVRPLQRADHHEAVASVRLNGRVPEEIAVHFDTARNLYLYAWFVYRFFPVAEHHAFTCLEFALSHRYGREIPKAYYKGKKPTLAPLLRYAIEKGDIRNEGFQRWHHEAEVRARDRQTHETIRWMEVRRLDEMTIDDDNIEITDSDYDWDYVRTLIDTLPARRNNYAHGSSTLHNTVLGTLRTVCECINQLY